MYVYITSYFTCYYLTSPKKVEKNRKIWKRDGNEDSSLYFKNIPHRSVVVAFHLSSRESDYNMCIVPTTANRDREEEVLYFICYVCIVDLTFIFFKVKASTRFTHDRIRYYPSQVTIYCIR